MNSTSEIRNKVIDRLMAIDDINYLKALDDMIGSSQKEHLAVPLTEEQKLMLSMSDEDIKANKLIDQDTLNKQERRWLKGK